MTDVPAMGEWLYDNLPELYRVRDSEQGYPLRDFLAVLGEQGDILRDEALRLYDNQFLETCEPWLVPYLAALFGYRPVHDIGDVSQRTLAAQWIALVAASVLLAILNSTLRGSGLDQIPAVDVALQSALLILVTALVCAVPAVAYWVARKAWMPELTRFAWLVWIVVGFAFVYGNYLSSLNRV